MMIHFAFYSVSDTAAWLRSEMLCFCYEKRAFNPFLKTSLQMDPVNK